MATGLFNLKQVNQAISQGAWSGYIAPKWVEYLVVAGGGGGGTLSGGGGGGGGLLTGIVTVAAGTSYTVTVGAGGSAGSNGVNSVFGAISGTGGGAGGQGNTGGGASGGSGGGGGYNVSIGGQGTSGQGNAGGAGTVASTGGAGGGGGAGTVGLPSVSALGGNGGAGIASAISGTVVTYAGGGGGVGRSPSAGGTGGVGGGGNGASSAVGSTGGGNTGGGGGDEAAGGSGIVVVRYPGNVQFYTGGAITYANGYIVHTFVASGTLAPTTPTVVTADYQISRSLRFNSADSTYLNRAPASTTNRQTWTWSGWLKRTALAEQFIFGQALSDTSAADFIFASNAFRLLDESINLDLVTTQVFRDPSAWYHIVVAVDTTQATSSNRVKLYVNGSQVTAFSTATYPSQNANTQFNTTNTVIIGRRSGGSTTSYFNGYMTEINWVDGQQLTPSSFGATNANTGVWSPKAYTGTYGTNGFYLNFSDNSNTTAATLGKDYSGNGNNFTPNNFSVTAGAGNDSLVDVPTNYGADYGVGGAVRGNYCTLNPVSGIVVYNANYPGINNGGMAFSPGVANWTTVNATMGVSSGKWYWEVSGTTANEQMHGVAKLPVATTANVTPYLSLIPDSYGYYSTNGNKTSYSAVSAAYGSSYTTNDVVGVALDMDAGTITFYKNGTSQGVAFTGLSGTFAPAFSANGNSSGITCNVNFGQRAWAYTPPNGFKALTTQNLPAPTVGSSPTTLANQFFAPVLYTGNGSTQSVTVGFQPDWVWLKNRGSTGDNGLYDVIRGTTNRLVSNSTNAADTISGVTAFNSDGFTLGADYNASANTFVSWNWKANGSGVSNTAGSITSTVSANTTSGFSVVTYTGTGSVATVGHGLGFAPYMVIVKRRNGVADWATWHTSIGTQVLFLNLTNAAASGTAQWNGTTPTSSVFTVSTSSGVNGSGGTYVAYCFAPIAGFSAFGSYTGNGSTDGVFVFTGMRPAYVLIKRTTSAYNWWILDAARGTINAVKGRLYADATDAESTTYPYMDFLSNGFKLRDADGGLNANGEPYIYACFAENPFKYSLAR